MSVRTTDDELDDIIKMIATGPGRRTIAAAEKAAEGRRDDFVMPVHAGVLKIAAEELRLADLRAAKLGVELLEARKKMKEIANVERS